MFDMALDAQFVPIMLGSAASGMLARIPMHPIDTIKARAQALTSISGPGSAATTATHANACTHYEGGLLRHAHDAVVAETPSIRTVFRSALATGGIRSLYQGFPIAFVGSAPASCLYFSSYEMSKRWFASSAISCNLPVSMQHFGAGLVAEAFSCVMWVPIDVLKERMQVAESSSASATVVGSTAQQPAHGNSGQGGGYGSTRSAVSTIIRTEGVRGLYRGYGATLASFGPFSALYFAAYEWAKGRAAAMSSTPAAASSTTGASASLNAGDGASLPFVWQVACASGAGAAASWVTSPLDLVKLRLQVQRATAASPAASADGGHRAERYRYEGTLHGLRTIAKTEGARGLWRGATARVLYHAPTTGISMLLFENCTAVARQLLSKDSGS